MTSRPNAARVAPSQEISTRWSSRNGGNSRTRAFGSPPNRAASVRGSTRLSATRAEPLPLTNGARRPMTTLITPQPRSNATPPPSALVQLKPASAIS